MKKIEENTKERTGLIYMATNMINGKKYIGQTTTTLNKRMCCHKYSYKNIKDGCKIFYSAIRKYGFDNFYWEKIEDNIPASILDSREIEYIKIKNSIKPNGYNISPGGSDLRFVNDMEFLNYKKFGWNLSELTKKRISKSNKGLKRSEEYKKMMSKIFLSDKNPSKREDVRKKISESAKGRKLTQEAKNKVGEFQKGRVKSEEHKKKIKEAHIKKHMGPHKDFNWLHNKYVIEDYSISDISKIAGSSRKSISSSIKEFGIPLKPVGYMSLKSRKRISENNSVNPRYKIYTSKKCEDLK